MARDRIHEEEASQDSFLDVVANVVGVLIILVMLVGMQATRSVVADKADSPAEDSVEVEDTREENLLSTSEFEVLAEQVKEAKRELFNSREQVVDLAQKVTNASHQASSQQRQRMELALHRSLIEQDIERRRKELDEEAQNQFDVQRALLQSQIKLEQLNEERVTLASLPEEVEEIESVPTPLAKVVDGPSIHLRVRNGLVSIVPVERLVEELKLRLPSIQRRAQSSARLIETVGPLEGYRLKFELEKRLRMPTGGATVGSRPVSELAYVLTYLPVSEDVGENIEAALVPGAKLHDYLLSHRRGSTPVDIWLYTDSFDKYSMLKKKLWEMGFAISTRPLKEGQHIMQSPLGTKSAAQ